MSRLSLVCPHCAREGKLPESVKTLPRKVKCPGCQKDFHPAAAGGDDFVVVPEGTDQLKETAKRAATAIGDGIKQTARKAKDYAESDQARALMEKTRRTAAEVGEKAKVTVSSMQGSGTRFLENPIVIGLSMLFCFPIGLFFVWRHSRWGKPVKWAWTGSLAAFLVFMMIIGAQARKADREALTEADSLWQKGDRAAAVAKYRPILSRLLDDEKPLAYGRVIDFDVDGGNLGEARHLLEEATRRRILPSVNSAEGKAILAKIESEASEAKLLQARRDKEAEDLRSKPSSEFRDQEREKSSPASDREVKSYSVSKGLGRGSIKIVLPTDRDLGIEFSDFELSSAGLLKYTLIWDASKGGRPKDMNWSSYDSKGVRLDGRWLNFGNSISSGEPTKGQISLGFEEWKKTVLIKIE